MSAGPAPPAAGALPPQGEEQPSRWPAWMKLVVLLLLLAVLGWIVLMLFQYFRTGTLEDLPLAPEVLGTSDQPQYVRSLEGVQRPLGVAVAPDGKVFVTESDGERKIHVYDPSGQEITSFAPPGTGIPTRIPIYTAVSPSGQVYVSDRDAMTIHVFSEDGAFLREIAPPSELGEMWHPLGVAFDVEGNLYVTDVTKGKHRLVVLDPAGGLKMEIGREGDADGEFSFPNGVAVDEGGRIFVADSNNGRVQVFDEDGEFLYKIGRGMAGGDLSLPRGIAIDGDRLFVVDAMRHAVQVYDVSEEPRYIRAVAGDSEARAFSYPNGLALDGDGHLYVTDRENNRVQVWSY